MPIEIKSGQTVNRDFFSSLERWMTLARDLAFSPALVYGGDKHMVRKGVKVSGWTKAGQILRDHNTEAYF